MKKTKAFCWLLALIALAGCNNSNKNSSIHENHSNSSVDIPSESTQEISSSNTDSTTSHSSNSEASSSEVIVDELKEEREEALLELESYIDDILIYSSAVQESMNNEKTTAKLAVELAKTKEEIELAVHNYKIFVDEAFTIKGEKAKEFIDGLTFVSTNTDTHYSYDKKTGEIVQNTEVGFYGEVKMGTTNENYFVAFDTYITFDYLNTQYSSATIFFRQWDNATTYSLSITDSMMSLTKKSYGNSDLLIQTTSGIQDNEKVHLQVLCSGWQKSILVNGVNVLEINESDFTVGSTSLITWETSLRMEDTYYHEYASVDEFNSVYGELIFLPNLNTKRSEAISEINHYVEGLSGINETSLNELRDLASSYVNEIAALTMIEEVTTRKETFLADLQEKYEQFKSAEEEAIRAEIEAKRHANEAFLTNHVTSKPDTISINELGQIYQSDITNETNLIIGSQNDGGVVALEMNITLTYPNTTWSYMTLHFREWDTSNNYYLSIQDGSLSVQKAVWGEETQILYTSEEGFKNNEQVNVKILCSGNQKFIVINENLLYKIDESSFTVGRVRILTWQTSYLIDSIKYTIYESDDALKNDYQELFDKIAAEEQQKLELKRQENENFLNNSMTEKAGNFSVNDLGQIYKDDVESAGQAIIGNQNDGDVVAFEMDITIQYRNTAWSSFTLHFREWDNSNNYYLSIQDGSISVQKAVWGEETQTLYTSEEGFKNNEQVNVKILCAGWGKAIYINNELFYKINESSYTCGRIRLESWEVAYTIDSIKYSTYTLTSDLLNDYPIAIGELS